MISSWAFFFQTAYCRKFAPQPFGALVDEWLDHHRSVGAVSSAHTEAAYRRDLARWARRIADLLNRA